MNGIILDENEQVWIEQFYDNERMRNAVKKVLDEAFSIEQGLNSMNTNENLGAVVRAKLQAKESLEKTFQMLSKIKTKKIKVEQGINEAR